MKVKAYRCDKCGRVRPEDEIMGITPIEDMFEALRSFPLCEKLDETNVHFCITCYDSDVISKANYVNKRKNMDEYNLKIKELGYALKQTCVFNVRNNKKFARME
jgi:ribosomal protein S26